MAAIASTGTGGKPLVVAYTATWCGPCVTMKPIYKALIDSYPDLDIKLVDYDTNRDAFGDAGISILPTIKAYKDGKFWEQFYGSPDESSLKEYFDKLTNEVKPRNDDSANTTGGDEDPYLATH